MSLSGGVDNMLLNKKTLNYLRSCLMAKTFFLRIISFPLCKYRTSFSKPTERIRVLVNDIHFDGRVNRHKLSSLKQTNYFYTLFVVPTMQVISC